MGNCEVTFQYESTKLKLYLDNGNYCILIRNREVADAIACLPEDAFREFAEEFITFYKSHYSKVGTKSARFRKWFRGELAKGNVPSIPESREWLNYQNKHKPEHGASLGFPYTRIRIEEFKRAGFIKDEESGYWQKPNKG